MKANSESLQAPPDAVFRLLHPATPLRDVQMIDAKHARVALGLVFSFRHKFDKLPIVGVGEEFDQSEHELLRWLAGR